MAMTMMMTKMMATHKRVLLQSAANRILFKSKSIAFLELDIIEIVKLNQTFI